MSEGSSLRSYVDSVCLDSLVFVNKSPFEVRGCSLTIGTDAGEIWNPELGLG